MKVVTRKIGHFHAVTGIWLCRKEVLKLLSGEDVSLIVGGEPPKPFYQSITIHKNEIGKDSSLEVEMDNIAEVK